MYYSFGGGSPGFGSPTGGSGILRDLNEKSFFCFIRVKFKG